MSTSPTGAPALFEHVAGDIAVSGAPPDADGWTVAIAPLEPSRAEPSLHLSLRDAAVSISAAFISAMLFVSAATGPLPIA